MIASAEGRARLASYYNMKAFMLIYSRFKSPCEIQLTRRGIC